ncbi:DUF4041 domain-containing protein [Aquimarina sp. 2201CG1-2-11]|uniref:GIY-YIG nuclease family protein n=1 Tax=Aquimarina discodermiae TaxID=3231043 RepID=UPI003462BB26
MNYFFYTVLIFLLFTFFIALIKKNSKHSALVNKHNKLFKSLKELSAKFKGLSEKFETYQKETDYLKKYEPIRDIEDELKKITIQMEVVIQKANNDATEIKKEAREKARQTKERAEKALEEAYLMASKIENNAQKKAVEIAGEAWEAKNKAEQYQKTIKAMKNIIKGYGDEYLIPGHSLLDELAEEYDHKKGGQELLRTRNLIKSMIKNDEVAECDYVDEYRANKAKEFVIDAFNGKVDTIMAKVKHDNYGKLLQSLQDAFRLVNHNGESFKNARIKEKYFEVVLDQLKIAVTVQELKKKDQEEQKAIREAMREEEKARREYEKAIKQAEKEEKMLAEAMRKAEERLGKAAADERAKFEAELEEIKRQLSEAEERGQRAISMAQQTRRGYVYIISNIGSFGENIFKIGLTRRLEPMDRVKELGDASVPFSFDVHAMIHAEDAPQLEKKLHEEFEINRLNKVNYRKEFFSVPIHQIKSKIEELGLETHWTMKAEALEYRESLEINKLKPELVSVNN